MRRFAQGIWWIVIIFALYLMFVGLSYELFNLPTSHWEGIELFIGLFILAPTLLLARTVFPQQLGSDQNQSSTTKGLRILWYVVTVPLGLYVLWIVLTLLSELFNYLTIG